MLPTPPYSAISEISYGHGSLPAMHTLNYPPLPTSSYEISRYDDYGYTRQYPQATNTSTIPRVAYHSDTHTYTSSVKAVQAQGSSIAYGYASGPVLPPIRLPDRSMDDYQQQGRSNRASAVTQQQPKEEKAGGVAAHLDYKMEEMVDFVSEMAQGIVLNSKSSVHPEFRRYVSQMLTATRLPSSTILLGLHYLATRMTMLSARGKYTYSGGDVYNMLTTALLLGSKFLDDNTFQNRSWSDVSNISVKKLNGLESEWLLDIKWDMHFDPSDPKGFALWRRRWQTFQVATPSKNIDFLAEKMKKTSIDSSFLQQQNGLEPMSSTTRYAPRFSDVGTVGHFSERSTQWQASRYDHWAPVQFSSEYSPASAPETGPNTPDYATGNGFGYGTLPPVYPSLKMPAPLHIVPSNAPAHGYPTPQYHQYASHGNYCGCGYCMPHSDCYSTNSAYDQAVAG